MWAFAISIFCNIDEKLKELFEKDMKLFRYGFRKINLDINRNITSAKAGVISKPYSKLRMLSGACVGRDTCRLTYTDSEKFEPYLIETDSIEEDQCPMLLVLWQ